jgi:hypothetical protein
VDEVLEAFLRERSTMEVKEDGGIEGFVLGRSALHI